MTNTSLKSRLRAVLSTAAIALGSGVARADDTSAANVIREPSGIREPSRIPDHAQAEARSGGATIIPAAEIRFEVPDHAQAENRGAGATIVPSNEAGPGVPDHAQAQARDRSGEPPSR
jgi:hypothetical protein